MPTGELPRSMQLVVDRHLVGKIAPGTRVTAYGIFSIYQASSCTFPPWRFVQMCRTHAYAERKHTVLLGENVGGWLLDLVSHADPSADCLQSESKCCLQSANKKEAAGIALRMPYIRVVGLEEETEGAHSTPVFT